MGVLRQFVIAFKPSNLKQGIDAARNPPSQEQIQERLKYLTPEQRRAYDANMAEVEQGRAESRAAFEEAKAINQAARILEGPAGDYLYGAGMSDADSPDAVEAKMMQQGTWATVQEMRAQRKGEFKQGLRQSFGIQEVEQIKEPAERERVAAAQRAERDAARAPYRAPEACPVTISRLATRGETQLAEVLAYLEQSGLATRPERVFGVYRVPDRISGPLTPHSEKGRVVEWDVVHAPLDGAPPGPPTPLVASSFAGAEQWVARRLGEPSVLDEDLALAFCLEAGVGPEQCLGLARMSEFRCVQGEGSDDGAGPLRTLVRGIVAIHPELPGRAFEDMRDRAPLPLAPDVAAAAGVHVEILNWAEIGRAVQLKIHHQPPVPSPFPYLPATPQELLRAYLDVVGVRPDDCYSAQATVDTPTQLVQGGFMSTNLGPKQPCVDGKDRMRTRGGEHVVFVYRDRPEYAAGRQRWDAYMWEVLQARLRNGIRARRPLELMSDDYSEVPTKVLRAAFRVAETIDRWDEWGVETIPPYRYCLPPVEP